MNHYSNILGALSKNNIESAELINDVLNHRNDLKATYQSNYLELKENKTNKYFFKLYVMMNGRWEFFDYGWLDKRDNYYVFHTYKTKLSMFNTFITIHQIKRKTESPNHVIVVDDSLNSYLLFNINTEVIDILISKIK